MKPTLRNRKFEERRKHLVTHNLSILVLTTRMKLVYHYLVYCQIAFRKLSWLRKGEFACLEFCYKIFNAHWEPFLYAGWLSLSCFCQAWRIIDRKGLPVPHGGLCTGQMFILEKLFFSIPLWFDLLSQSLLCWCSEYLSFFKCFLQGLEWKISWECFGRSIFCHWFSGVANTLRFLKLIKWVSSIFQHRLASEKRGLSLWPALVLISGSRT